MLPEHRQRLLIAGEVTDHGVGVDAGENRRSRAQSEAAKLTVLYLEDERRRRFALRVDGG